MEGYKLNSKYINEDIDPYRKYQYQRPPCGKKQSDENVIQARRIDDILVPEFIYTDLKITFLSLDEIQLKQFFYYYGLKYGNGAKAYARHTYEAWSNGSVAISSEIQKRILQTVPKFLSPDERFRLFECILQYNLKSKYHPQKKVFNYILTIKEFEEKKNAIIQNMYQIINEHYKSIEYSKLFDLSSIDWIVDKDISAFNKLLQNVEIQRANNQLKEALIDLEEISTKWNSIDWSTNSTNELEICKNIEVPPLLRVNLTIYNKVYRQIQSTSSSITKIFKVFSELLGGLFIFFFPIFLLGMLLYLVINKLYIVLFKKDVSNG